MAFTFRQRFRDTSQWFRVARSSWGRTEESEVRNWDLARGLWNFDEVVSGGFVRIHAVGIFPFSKPVSLSNSAENLTLPAFAFRPPVPQLSPSTLNFPPASSKPLHRRR